MSDIDQTADALIRALLASERQGGGKFSEWWRSRTSNTSRPIARALLDGGRAPNLAFAFGAGYQAAIHALFPAFDDDLLSAICVTEKGGGHPRAIKARLTPDGEAWTLSGEKHFITLGEEAHRLIIAASRGVDEAGLNDIAMVAVARRAQGVTLTSMPSLGMISEIGHGALRLDAARVEAASVLDGDGYRRYIRPFRTVEDIHVHAAVLGYLITEGRSQGWAPSLLESLVAAAMCLRGLAAAPASAPTTHVALAGAMTWLHALLGEVDEAFEASGGDGAEGWRRDRPLMSIAQRARRRRAESAWSALGVLPGKIS